MRPTIVLSSLLMTPWLALPLVGQSLSDSTPPARLPATTVATFPAKTFLENLVVLPTGDVLVTSYLEGKVYRLGARGAVTPFATLPGTIAGITVRGRGLLVTGWRDGKVPAVFELSATGAVGTVTPLAGAAFPNGIAPFAGDTFLIADSYRGLVWRYDASAHHAEPWLRDTLLARADTANPVPGVNGVHRVGTVVYLTNTQRGLLLRVPVTKQGAAGVPVIAAHGPPMDDFVVAPDGSVYAATHVVNSVIRLSPSGRWTTVGTLADGLAGSTSVVRTESGGPALLITTNGGMSVPPPGGVQPARVVRLSLSGAARLSRP